ncbi:hypothetical protein [Leptospira brenneri]|uniref:hypothetical protein n=1 Tax=Leptospira brenneri TaxID=2023182 RepID=UPI000C2A6BF1|nr:hypothetical protein [Leptospira brenneri]PJZ43638.1 hypothetical protein CH361_19395 [Leptospira brenneri]
MEQSIRFIEKSLIESENIAVFELIKFIRLDNGLADTEINIYKIKEEENNTPDFYTTGFSSVIEIKQITENQREMSIVGSTKNQLLDKIANEIIPQIKHKNRNYYVRISDNIPLKSRGKEYKALISSITHSINSEMKIGKSGQFYYTIIFNNTPQTQTYLQIGYVGARNTNSDILSNSILPLLEKSKIQFDQFTSKQKSIATRILLFDHLYTFTPNSETIISAISKAYSSKENSYWPIDSIYLKFFGNIIRIN